MCPILKKLSTKLQPFHEVIQIKDEILASKKKNDIRVLKHLLSYLEYQFGEKVEAIDYRERADGERISNWKVEIEILHYICVRLAKFYSANDLLVSRDEKSLPFMERSLSLLNPWLIQLDLDASNRIDGCNDHQMNCILHKLFCVEQNMAALTINSQQFDIAEGHCQRCLAYSRRYGSEGEEKTTHILKALEINCCLRQMQTDYSGAVILLEKLMVCCSKENSSLHSCITFTNSNYCEKFLYLNSKDR
jgi:hypothetical protein